MVLTVLNYCKKSNFLLQLESSTWMISFFFFFFVSIKNWDAVQRFAPIFYMKLIFPAFWVFCLLCKWITSEWSMPIFFSSPSAEWSHHWKIIQVIISISLRFSVAWFHLQVYYACFEHSKLFISLQSPPIFVPVVVLAQHENEQCCACILSNVIFFLCIENKHWIQNTRNWFSSVYCLF